MSEFEKAVRAWYSGIGLDGQEGRYEAMLNLVPDRASTPIEKLGKQLFKASPWSLAHERAFDELEKIIESEYEKIDEEYAKHSK